MGRCQPSTAVGVAAEQALRTHANPTSLVCEVPQVKFHEHRNVRAAFRACAELNNEPLGIAARRKSLVEFYEFAFRELVAIKSNSDDPDLRALALETLEQIAGERLWLADQRPYVNLYPIIEDVIRRIRLDVRWTDVRWPHQNLLFRFGTTGSSLGWQTALLSLTGETDRNPINNATRSFLGVSEVEMDAHGGGIRAHINFFDIREFKTKKIPIPFLKTESLVSETVDRWESDSESGHGPDTAFIARMAVFTALVWENPEIVTPVLTAVQKQKMENATEQRKQEIIERGAKQNGWGFDLGKDLQEQRDISAHFRMPHFALYHTGEGGRVPKIILRSGAMVKHQHGLKVPTGFLGPETDEEREWAEKLDARVPLSLKERWWILKRDNFTCQLCGATRADSVKLEIDHKVPVAKGGTNAAENLWVTCFSCNRGKGTDQLP